MEKFDPEKILNREPTKVALKKALHYVKGKRVLITGAGGSIGSELSRQLLISGASRLYLFGHGENSIYSTTERLRLIQKEKDVKLIPIIGEMQDREYMKFLMKRLEVDYVFHTAAHKHVDMMERNPVEVIKNNVFGTKNVVEASKESGVSRFLLISTDKAVDPVSVYGASKYLAEEIVLKENDGFLVVRFGNVLGSKGSVLHTFVRQIKNGGPITITDENMKRYFMSISEAVSLVLKIGGIGKVGELYHLDMGEPIYIKELAENLMKFYNKKVPIEYIGMRSGEKLEEKLWTDYEKPENTRYRGIIRLHKTKMDEDIDDILERLKPICFFDPDFPDNFRNRQKLKNILKLYFPTLKLLKDEPKY